MKTMIIAITMIMSICGGTKTETPKVENLYPISTIVTEIDEENDLVMCEDFNGNEWVFEGVEDWFIGDICAMMMNDCGTDIIYDDEIVSVRYCGWVE